MDIYNCYFLDGKDRIELREIIETERLGDAIEQARDLLRQRPQHHAIELWQGPRKLYRSLPRRPPRTDPDQPRAAPDRLT